MIAAVIAAGVVLAWLVVLAATLDRRILARPVVHRRDAQRAVVVYRDVYGEEVEISDEFLARMDRYFRAGYGQARQLSQALAELARAFQRAVIPIEEWHRRWLAAIERSREP